MTNPAEHGIKWRREPDGMVAYRATRKSPTHVITEENFQRIVRASTHAYAAIAAGLLVVATFNGIWWRDGYRVPEFVTHLSHRHHSSRALGTLHPDQE